MVSDGNDGNYIYLTQTTNELDISADIVTMQLVKFIKDFSFAKSALRFKSYIVR